MDWGYDICEFIFKASGLYTTIVCIDDISRGIRAELIEFWCLKSWRREELADLGDAICRRTWPRHLEQLPILPFPLWQPSPV
jgi:hypothetical protein